MDVDLGAARGLSLPAGTALMRMAGPGTGHRDNRAAGRPRPLPRGRRRRDYLGDTANRVEQRLASLLDNLDTIPQAGQFGGRRADHHHCGVPVARVLPVDAENNLTDLDVLSLQWAAIRASLRVRASGDWVGADASSPKPEAQSRTRSPTSLNRRFAPYQGRWPLLVIGLFLLLAWVVRRLLRALFRRTIADRTLENPIKQLVYDAIVMLGVAIGAGALGTSPQTLVTGLGLTGLVLGFALKDILSSFVGGLLILALRPFEIGDPDRRRRKRRGRGTDRTVSDANPHL